MRKQTEPNYSTLLTYFSERNPDIVKAYQTWGAYTFQQKDQAYREWNTYYESCQKSEAADNFRLARTCLLKKDMSTLRDIVSRSKEMLVEQEWIQKPIFVDPHWFMYDARMSSYRFLLKKIQDQSEKIKSGIF